MTYLTQGGELLKDGVDGLVQLLHLFAVFLLCLHGCWNTDLFSSSWDSAVSNAGGPNGRQSRSISPRVVTILSTPFRETCADEFEEPIQGCTEAVKEEVSICGESIQWWSIESDS